MMEVTAWNNGYHAVTGGGYGLEIKVADRDRYFDKEWKTVRIALAGIPDESVAYRKSLCAVAKTHAAALPS